MAYIINFSEPTKSSFTINDNGFDGPGGSAQSSTLRLYGRGALEWGESVDEDLLRSLESYASATPPYPAVEGQLWFGVALYWYNIGTGQWFRWDYPAGTSNSSTMAPLNSNGVGSTLANGSWVSITPIIYTSYAALQAATGTIGQYAFVTDTPGNTIRQLYRWDIPYAEAAPQWMPRLYRSINGNPTTGSNFPTGNLYVYNPYILHHEVAPTPTSASANLPTINGWYDTSSIRVQTGFPSNPTVGQMLLLTNGVPTLMVWDGTSWGIVNITYNDIRYVFKSGDTMTGPLYLNADPTLPTQAATKNYVDSIVGGASYVHIAGSTMTGPLYLNADPTLPTQASTKNYTDSKLAVTGGPLSGTLNMTGNYITNVATPINNNDAANKIYVDSHATFTLPVGAVIMLYGVNTALGGPNFDGTGLGVPGSPFAGATGTWAVCNGNHGTPNLIGQFVLGLAPGAANATGGSSTTNATSLTGATANAYTGVSNIGTALTAAQLPPHQHGMFTGDYPGWPTTAPTSSSSVASGGGGHANYEAYFMALGTSAVSVGRTDSGVGLSGSGHTHTVSDPSHAHSINLGTHTHTFTPPYYSLVYIMRVA